MPVAAFVAILALPASEPGPESGLDRATELCSLSNALRYGVFLAMLLVAFFLGEVQPAPHVGPVLRRDHLSC